MMQDETEDDAEVGRTGFYDPQRLIKYMPVGRDGYVQCEALVADEHGGFWIETTRHSAAKVVSDECPIWVVRTKYGIWTHETDSFIISDMPSGMSTEGWERVIVGEPPTSKGVSTKKPLSRSVSGPSSTEMADGDLPWEQAPKEVEGRTSHSVAHIPESAFQDGKGRRLWTEMGCGT